MRRSAPPPPHREPACPPVPSREEDTIRRVLAELDRHNYPDEQDDRPGTELVVAPPRPVERYDVARHVRIRKQQQPRVLPWKLGATSAVTGYAGWGAGLLAEAVSGPLAHLAVTGGTGLTAAVACTVLRWRHREALAGDTRWYRAATAGGAAWAAGTAAWGPGWLGLVALGGWTRAVSQGWLTRHRPALPGATTAPDQADIGGDEPDDDIPAWTPREHPDPEADEGTIIRAALTDPDAVFGGRGGLAGVELRNQERLDRGWRWRAQLPTNLPYSRTRGCEEMIAVVLHTGAGMVQWEPVPGDVSQAVLTVITVDLLADGFPYPGPEYYDGRVPIGRLADGEGRADAVVADASGVHCCAFTGDKRMGKSTGSSELLLGLLESGLWVTVFSDGDPTKGSHPLLAAEADWPAAGPERILAQLSALEGILEARQHTMPTLTRDTDTGLVVPMTRPGQERIDKLLPGDAGFPGVYWFFDEFHKLANSPVLLDADFLGRLLAFLLVAAKYGMGGAASAHSVHRSDWGDTSVFAAFAGRQHFAFYAHNPSEYVLSGGERVTLNGLPTDGGYFLAPHVGRVVPGRTPHPVTRGDRVFHRPGLHEVDLLGAGQWWPTGERDPAGDYLEAIQARQEWRERAEARLRGDDPGVGEAEEEDYSGYGPDAPPLRLVPPPPQSALVPATAGMTASQATRAAILAAVQRLGRCANKDIHTAVPGVLPSSMTKHLGALAKEGLVTNLGYAGWEPAQRHAGTGS